MECYEKEILIVDDEQAIADLVEVYLSNEGMEVLKCYNGKDALDCIRKKNCLLRFWMSCFPTLTATNSVRRSGRSIFILSSC